MSAQNVSQSFGFPVSPTAKQAPVTRPTPLPRRPKGRWFIGALLLTACAFSGYQVWDSFFRYKAYGTVTGRVVQVSPPWEGEIAYLHVREGDRVRQGDVLVVLENFEMRQRLEQIDDDLRLAEATLAGEAARLKWQVAFQLDHSQSAAAKLLEVLAQLEQEKALLTRLQYDWDRTIILLNTKVISKQEADRVRLEREGQAEKVSHLKKALAEYESRGAMSGVLLAKNGDLGASLAYDGTEQLKPSFARINGLHAERQRLQAKLERGRLKAPTNGTVVKIHHFAGERTREGEPVLALLEEGSLRVVLYMPQSASQALEIGANVDVHCDPFSQGLPCKVLRYADLFEPAPEHLKRHYSAGQNLLPVSLEPAPEAARWLVLRIGETVKLP